MDTTDLTIFSPHEIDLETYLGKHALLKEYTDKMQSSPKSIRHLIISLDTAGALVKIGYDFSLAEEQSASLTRIVRDTLLGDLYIGDMPALIQQKLQIDDRTAQGIASRIVSDIFKPGLEDIKKMQIEKFKDRIGKGSPMKSSSPAPSENPEAVREAIQPNAQSPAIRQEPSKSNTPQEQNTQQAGAADLPPETDKNVVNLKNPSKERYTS